ncbi:Antagonist of like heterochromatin protein [Thalictrum thalictroides]|uniref:Antagonist of like heterochromatin protein n=1 Tax=Thalictrum thalictroides TaxID=46969 RepID=A0A7J6WQP2_THATH|nr:Antagonist of like heterochromatin protein [Thalictrum thalictroides]
MTGGENGIKTTTKKRQNQNKNNHRRRQNHHQHLQSLISLLASATTAAHNFLTQNDLQLPPSQSLTLESKITSAALSISKLHSLILPTLNLSNTPSPSINPSPSSSSQCWFQRFLSTTSSLTSSDCNKQWVEAFRMSKPSFDLLLETLIPSLENSTCNVPLDYILGAALLRLAHGGSYKAVGKRFGIDSARACRAFYDVCKAVNDQLGHLFELSTDLKRIVKGFGWISLPNCCGVLGFTRFLVEGEGFGKDGGVIVQGLVDSEGRFLDVSAGWPSSMNPNTILQQSKLFARVEESKELFNGALFELENGNLIPQYILGNSCCPLLPWLLTPYPKSIMDDDLNSDSSEEAFNAVHNRCMSLVSTAFRRVRARWRLLSVTWKEECVEFLPFVVVTGCLLHNFMIKCGEVVPDDTDVQFWEQEFPTFEGKGNVNGERIRDVLAWQLCLHVNQQLGPMQLYK